MYNKSELIERVKKIKNHNQKEIDLILESINILEKSFEGKELDFILNKILTRLEFGLKLEREPPLSYSELNTINILSTINEKNKSNININEIKEKINSTKDNEEKYLLETQLRNELVISLKSFKTCNENNTNNFLLLGDNIFSLSNLSIVFDGNNKGVDFIYIDPPYNTKNSQTYNNKFDYSDWLQQIKDKLIISRNILKENGSIMISIDDNMHAYLKVICDEVFGEENFLGNFIVGIVASKRKNAAMGRMHEYILCYCKNSAKFTGYSLEPTGELKPFLRVGSNSSINERPKRHYPILLKDGNLFSIDKEEFELLTSKIIRNEQTLHLEEFFITLDKISDKYKAKGFQIILPESNGKKMVWQNEFNRFNESIKKFITVGTDKNRKSLPIYEFDQEKNKIMYRQDQHVPSSIWVDKETVDFEFDEVKGNRLCKESISSSNGKKELKKIFTLAESNESSGEYFFSSPKPPFLMKKIISIATRKLPNAIILDYYGGSGSTAQAVLEMNQEDLINNGVEGKRTFIICTNVIENYKPEGKQKNVISEVGKICYERIYRIMNGIPSNVKIENTSDIKKLDLDKKFRLGGNLEVFYIKSISINNNNDFLLSIIDALPYIKLNPDFSIFSREQFLQKIHNLGIFSKKIF